MASQLNSCSELTNGDFIGQWEDVQAYTSVTVHLVSGQAEGDISLHWVNESGDNIPDDNTLSMTEDTIIYLTNQTITKQFKTKARWFKIYAHSFAGSNPNQVSVTTTYKKAPTEIQLGDRRSNMLSINPSSAGNSLYTVLVDQGGELLGTTNALAGEAMYTHLSASGSSLATTFDGILRSVTDVSFVLTTGDEGYGTVLPDSNSFRLPRSQIKFRDGDEIFMGMGLLDDTNFVISNEIQNDISGIGVTGRVHYLKMEDDYVQFQVLVNKDTREWFNPSLGTRNVDVSAVTINNPDIIAGADNGYIYLKQVHNDDTLITVDDYYSKFSTESKFGNMLTLTSGNYPLDVRLYRGSLAHITNTVSINTINTNGANGYTPGPGEVNGIIRGTELDVSISYELYPGNTVMVGSGYLAFGSGGPMDISGYLGNISWTSASPRISDHIGDLIDISIQATSALFSVELQVVENFNNLHVLSVKNGDSLREDTLGVAIRDGQNMDVDTTKGVDTYHFDPDRPAGSNVLFLMDVSFAAITGDTYEIITDISSAFTGFKSIMEIIQTNSGAGSIKAGVTNYDGVPSTLKPYNDSLADASWTELLNDPGQPPIPVTLSGSYNLWYALSFINNNDYPDLDTIVVFHYGDDISATYQQRTVFDACASYFDGINRIVVTRSDRGITDLLPLAGSSNNILYYDNIPNYNLTWNEVTTGGSIEKDGNTTWVINPPVSEMVNPGWAYIYAYFETAGSFEYDMTRSVNLDYTVFEHVTQTAPTGAVSGTQKSAGTHTVSFDAHSYVVLGVNVINNINPGPSITVTFSNLPISWPSSLPTFFSTDTTFHETLAKHIAGRAQTGHNAVYVVNTDVSGHPQAGTDIITSNLGDGVAMYYALADNSGISISSTNVSDGDPDNAMYVTLANGNVGVTTDNPLNVAVQESTKPGLMFHYSISGYPYSNPLLGNNSLRITHLGATNDSPIPLWLKIYDMSSGYFNDNSAATLGIDASAFTLKDKLVYNLAVPPMDYRDIEFPKGLAINDGLYLATSTTHAYDSYGTIGAAQMYVQGQYFDTSGPPDEWDIGGGGIPI